MRRRHARARDVRDLAAIPALLPAALAIALALPLAPSAGAACPIDPANPVLHVSPPNGSLDVARFPVVSVAFRDPIPADGATLAECIRVLDRIGDAAALTVRRSATDDRVAVAVPASAADRLEPAEDYVVEVRVGDPDPSLFVRTRFQTGALKSVFCIEQNASGAWENRCDETYWREDPTIGQTSCGPDDPDNPCTCVVEETVILGGRRAVCTCAEEEDFLSASPDPFVVVASVDPPAGGHRAASDLAAPIVARLDGDLGTSAPLYRATLDDVTFGDLSPSPVGFASLVHEGNELRIEGASLAPDRRYRAGIELDGPAPPGPGEPRLLGPEAHRFSWTFNTWTGPAGNVLAVLPGPRTDRVGFPTHLPTSPHLRLVLDGPLARGAGDVEGPLLRLAKHDGTPAHGFATSYDVDMHRLHLMVHEALEEGERYEVFCTPRLAGLLGDPQCETVPLARFLTQVTPPDEGTDDVREGAWTDLEPPGEIWLAVRPTLLNHPYGFKERYATDAEGPASFLGHVLLVPPSKPAIGTIAVDPSPACRSIDPQPDPRCDGATYFLASLVSCVDDPDCPEGTTCEDCPSPGNDGCPTGARRCRYSKAAYQTRLTDFCRDVIDNGFAACSVQDAIRCTIGGTDACAFGYKNRMNAASEEECPSTHALHPSHNCVPRGRLALRLAPGEHHAYFEVHAWDARTYDETLGDFVERTAPVIVEPSQTGQRTVFASTVGLPSEGLDIPDDVCRTAGGPDDGYVCQENLGVCHEPTWACVPAAQGRTPCASDDDCMDAFRCDATTGVCVIDGNDPAFTCTDGLPQHPEVGGTCTAEWVQVDATWNIWRLWWPHHPDSSGSRRYNFAARIADAAGGPFTQLPVLVSTSPDYDVCDVAADPAACVVSVCDDWNDLDYPGQVETTVDLLRTDARPAPHAVWAVGYRVLKGGVSDPSTETCALSQVGGNGGDLEQDGPQGVFVKLPPGKTPLDFRIEGSRKHLLASFGDGHDLAFRGLLFQGFPQPLLISNADGIAMRGNQFVGRGSAQVLWTLGTTTRADFSDNFHSGTGSVDQRATTANARVINNVLWNVHTKLHSSFYAGDMRAVPTVCTDPADPDCVLPPCREDFDCRIPFMDSGGSMTADPNEAGLGPTCEAIDPAIGIGTCSHGVVDQTVFADNALLDGEGPNNGPWYTFRMQRNHLENGATQELFDGTGGVAWVWLLDNHSYNAATALNHFILQNWRPAGQEWFLRSASVENNLVVKNAREYTAQHARTGKIYPRRASATIVQIENKVGPDGADGTGARVVQNTLRERVSGFDWGAGISGGLGLVNSPGSLVVANTILSETKAGINVYDRDPVELLTSGLIDGNLVLPNSRETYEDNICDSSIIPDINKAAFSPVRICDNASWRPDDDRDPTCGYLFLASDFRRRALVEPFPYSYPLDMETMQRRIVSTPDELWATYRRWPVYDPVLAGDGLRVRPGHPACVYGDAGPAACDDPDADRDLYHRDRDNCPATANPDQTDTDGDSFGNACDGDDDDDGVADESDCAPLDPGTDPPGEVGGLSVEPAGAGVARVAWQAEGAGSAYDVVGGLVSELARDDGIAAAACLADDLGDLHWDDARPDPPEGDARYYLVRAQNGCGPGTYGATDSEGNPSEPAAGCP